MLNLSTILLFMLFAAIAAWLWHAHGLRERALELVKQHCLRNGLLLLDDNVALRRMALLSDAVGRKRLARIYQFEFTVTGEQRHTGRITLFGRHLGGIQLPPHPLTETAQNPPSRTIPHPPTAKAMGGQVIYLNDWRQRHSG
ncbi:hypothetical protein AXE65_02860 [Ventosimonas gracilis]|uniref:DUF3301 domain-containing protein n=1 Tax=Ventosimonas gracilis TaxID=1680762 RepID=A0A139SSJ1_9GAMM|nr:hypothetical protein AXE65_02860 [Ventosimonas gracilis]